MQIPILLPNIFNYPFTYESDKKLNPGTYVKVSFGRKTITGVVSGIVSAKNCSIQYPRPASNSKTAALHCFSQYARGTLRHKGQTLRRKGRTLRHKRQWTSSTSSTTEKLLRTTWSTTRASRRWNSTSQMMGPSSTPSSQKEP